MLKYIGRIYCFAPIAQWIEHLPSKQGITVRFCMGVNSFKTVNMSLRELNHKRILWTRKQKTLLAKFLFDKKNNNHFSPSQIKTIKKILFLRHDNKFGDMIVSTVFYKNLKNLLPNAEIHVVSGPSTKVIIENNKNISAVYPYKTGWLNALKLGQKLRKQNFDLVIDIDRVLTAQTVLLLRLISARFVFGFNRDGYGLYNIKRQYNFGQEHISNVYKKIVDELKLAPKDYNFDAAYSLFIPKEITKLTEKLLKILAKDGFENNKPLVIFNPFAASKHRSLSDGQAKEIAQNLPDYNFLIIGPENKLKNFLPAGKPKNLFIVPPKFAKQGGINLSLALLKMANFLITPDTYIVHAAVAFNKPQICIYRGVDQENIRLWGPNSDKAIILEAKADNKDIPAETIIENFKKLVDKNVKP